MLIDPAAIPPPGSELGSTPALNMNRMFALTNTPAGQAPGTVPFTQSGSDAPSAVISSNAPGPPPPPPPLHPESRRTESRVRAWTAGFSRPRLVRWRGTAVRSPGQSGIGDRQRDDIGPAKAGGPGQSRLMHEQSPHYGHVGAEKLIVIESTEGRIAVGGGSGGAG